MDKSPALQESSLTAAHHHDDFPFRRGCTEIIEKFLQRAAVRGVVQFRDFAGDGRGAFGPEGLDELAQGLDQPEGRFIENHRPRLPGKLRQARLPAFLDREESFKAEAVAGEARIDEGRHESRGPGQCLHLDARLHAGTHQQEARVGDAGGAGVADQGDGLACQDPVAHAVHFPVLVELMVRLHPGGDFIVLEQHRTGPGVFRQDQVGLLEDADGPERHVFKIAYRRRNDIEFCHNFRTFVETSGPVPAGCPANHRQN